MHLPHECLEHTFSYFGDSLSTLYNCSRVSHSWRQATIRLLYRNPWVLLTLPKYGKYAPSEEQRVKCLLRTLLGSCEIALTKEEIGFIGTKEANRYSNYLSLLKVFDFRYMAPWHEDFILTPGDKITRKLWRYVRENCSKILKSLVFVEILSLTDVFPLGISYPSLRDVCFHIEDLELSHGTAIARACHNIQNLRVRAHYLEDAAIAKVISAQVPQNLREVSLVCDRGVRSINETISTLSKYHRYSCTELKFTFQSCGLFFTDTNKKAILGIAKLPNLRVLELSCCKCVDDECIIEIARNCLFLKEIDLSSTLVTVVGITYLMNRLGVNLKRVILSQNSGNVIESVLPIVSKYCPKIQHLDIRGLPYTLSDMQHILDCCELTTLVLGSCIEPVMDIVEKMLCQLIRECRSLNHLEFGRVSITEKVILAIAEHSQLRSVKLHMNNLSTTPSMVECMIKPKIVQFAPF